MAEINRTKRQKVEQKEMGSKEEMGRKLKGQCDRMYDTEIENEKGEGNYQGNDAKNSPGYLSPFRLL